MFTPLKVCVPVPAFTKLKVVGLPPLPEFEITPLNVPVPLSFPTDKAMVEPAPLLGKSTLPVPVSVPMPIVPTPQRL